MKRTLLWLLVACAPATAFAQDEATKLDLVVPTTPIQFASNSGEAQARYRNDPPGTYYGDIGGASAMNPDVAAAAEGWQVHGSLEAGIGYSKQTGNSQWQAAHVQLDKTYVDDDGDTSHVNLSLSVGQGDGPMFGSGYFHPGYYGYGDPMPVDEPPPRPRAPFRR